MSNITYDLKDLETWIDVDGDKWIAQISKKETIARLLPTGELISQHGMSLMMFNEIFKEVKPWQYERCSKCGDVVKHKCPFPLENQTPGTLVCSRCLT